MIKVQNKKSGKIIEVPSAHWDGVLAKQGNYEVVVEEPKKAPPKRTRKTA